VLVTDEDEDNPTNTTTTPSQQLADILRVCSDKISIIILTAIETANRLNICATGPYLLQELEVGKSNSTLDLVGCLNKGS
jgi:hypothetical protein